MTEEYDSCQNAIAERINGVLKQEFIGSIKVKMVEMMSNLIKNSVQVYNTFRPHFYFIILSVTPFNLGLDNFF